MRTPKASEQADFVRRFPTRVEAGVSHKGTGLSASLKILADAGLSSWRASIPDAEQATQSVGTAALGQHRHNKELECRPGWR
jgi:hypothetical protein